MMQVNILWAIIPAAGCVALMIHSRWRIERLKQSHRERRFVDTVRIARSLHRERELQATLDKIVSGSSHQKL